MSKTWKQLEAMAKRQGLTLDWRARFCAVDRGTREVFAASVDDAVVGISASRILRAMTYGALMELLKK